MNNREWLDKTELLHNTLRAYATYDTCPSGDYEALRSEFISNPVLRPMLPDCVIKYRNLGYFWDFIKNKFSHYNERRQFLNEEFATLYNYFEVAPAELDSIIAQIATEFNETYIHELWQKALERREIDPDGAITVARTLLEATCKHILDLSGELELYKDTDDLPALYNKTASVLNLSPSQHTEQQFKQILSGCISVVNGLASLRNKLSDAHGGGTQHIRPSTRHASLCVNLAGTVAMFLMETWENNQD